MYRILVLSLTIVHHSDFDSVDCMHIHTSASGLEHGVVRRNV